jgi:hypothetical protein
VESLKCSCCAKTSLTALRLNKAGSIIAYNVAAVKSG